MRGGFDAILGRLASRDILTPRLELAVMADNWPDSYTIRVDSSPYYGFDEDGQPDGYFHPSSMPMLGARQLYLMLHPRTRSLMVPERPSLQRQMTLAMGSALHAVLQVQMQMCEVVTPENIEKEYIDPVHHIRGRIDWIAELPTGRYVTEFKTMNHHRWSKQHQIKPEWDAQLSIALDNENQDMGILLLAEAGWPYRLKEFHVPKNTALLEQVYAKFDHVRDCIARDTPPAACCGLDSEQMQECPARFQCWMSEDENDWPKR